MKAIILAAGRGSRMKSLTDERPKCLVELYGQTLLSMQLAALRTAGIEKIAIITGYLSDRLSNVADHEFHNARWAETNMVASLCEAQHWLEAAPCIVSYSDIFYEPTAVRSLMELSDPLAITYDPNWQHLWMDRFGDPLLDAEAFKLSADGLLLEIGSKPENISEVQGQYMGLLRVAPEGWAEMNAMLSHHPSKARDSMDMTSALQHILYREKMPIRAVAYNGKWGEVDSSEDLSLYESHAH